MSIGGFCDDNDGFPKNIESFEQLDTYHLLKGDTVVLLPQNIVRVNTNFQAGDRPSILLLCCYISLTITLILELRAMFLNDFY
jgi:hypothetical protein